MNSETFRHIWDKVIFPAFYKMNLKHGNLHLPEPEESGISIHYHDTLNYAKEHYMLNEEGVLNRHKVCAAIMIAILKAKPIKKTDPIYYQPDECGRIPIWTFNERLAITTALSVLRSFILVRVDYAFSKKIVSRKIFEDVCLQDKEIFQKGVPISQKEKDSWERELYHIRQDGAYNLLSFAHILSGIEERARLSFFLEHKEIEPTYPDPMYLTDKPVEMLTLDEVVANN